MTQLPKQGGLEDPKCRALLLGALACSASDEIAVSVAVAAGFNVSVRDLKDRRLQDSVFKEQCENAVARTDHLVEYALLKTAIAGDVKAQMFWLTNRVPRRWKDKKEIDLEIRDIPGAIRTAAERARARKALLLAAAAEAPPDGLDGIVDAELVPEAPGGNGHGPNGNGQG